MSAVQAKSRMVDFVNLVFGLVFSAVAGKKLLFTDNQKDGEFSFPFSGDIFCDCCGGDVADFSKAGFFEKHFHVSAVKAEVKHAGIIVMKQAIFLVEIGDTETSSGKQKIIQWSE